MKLIHHTPTAGCWYSANCLSLVAAGLEDWVDFGVICGLLLLNAVVGFVQEYQAGSIVDELKK
jgi:Cation transport ATPase